MDDDKAPKVISDVAHPEPEAPAPAPQVQQPVPETIVEPQAIQNEAAVDTKTKAPVVTSKDNSNLKLTIIIVVSVVVALALIGAGYMAFMQPKEEPAVVEVDTRPEDETPTQSVDAATIDQESAEIDGILNDLNEEIDFPEDELDDTNLGL